MVQSVIHLYNGIYLDAISHHCMCEHQPYQYQSRQRQIFSSHTLVCLLISSLPSKVSLKVVSYAVEDIHIITITNTSIGRNGRVEISTVAAICTSS